MVALPACNPYQNFSGEYFAGSIDATSFQPQYQGSLPGPADQGGGVFNQSVSFSKGKQIFYYLFPFSDAQMGQSDPLALDSMALTLPKTYLFDADPTNDDPFPKAKCNGPANYIYDQRTEDYRADQQGAVFSVIPTDPTYIPVVAEDPETAAGRTCQDIKSKETLLSVMKDPGPDTHYLAFAIIDPTADVQPNDPNTGLGPIHLGWFDHYLLTYLEGGYIPTQSVMNMNGTDPYTAMVPQTLLAPTVMAGMDGSGNMVAVPAGLGAGHDILDHVRGEAGYSPVCHVLTYAPDDFNALKTSMADLSPAELASAASADADQGFIFCLQP